jgi:hypothetical protein
MLIDAELYREDHGSISTTAIGRGLKPFDVRIDPKWNTYFVISNISLRKWNIIV